MMIARKRPGVGVAVYSTIAIGLGAYFAFASVQGNYGLFRRIQIDAEISELRQRAEQLDRETAMMENKTRRLSDEYLDLDLLDEQARDVLGFVRTDEIVIR